MDWDHLRIFLAVARTGRVAAAARGLRIEHTTVSRRLGALEAQLGASLFRRTVSGYVLTDAGRDIFALAESMERTALAIGVGARATIGKLSGTVRIGLPPEFASDWLAPHLPAFRARYPDIQLHLLVGTRTLDLSHGDAELALRTPRPHQVGLVTARIARTTARLYATKALIGKRRVQITDADSAKSFALLVYTSQLRVLQNAPWFQAVKAGPNVFLETNSTHTLLAAARAGVGIAVLPPFVARNYEDLVAVSEPVADQEVWLVTHPEFRRDPKVRATADFLKEVAKGPSGLA